MCGVCVTYVWCVCVCDGVCMRARMLFLLFVCLFVGVVVPCQVDGDDDEKPIQFWKLSNSNDSLTLCLT